MDLRDSYWQQGLTANSASIDEAIEKACEKARNEFFRHKYPPLNPYKIVDELTIRDLRIHDNAIDDGSVSIVWNHDRNKKVEIKKVIFNVPATIVFWSDGDKTVVKATNEPFDSEKGLSMAIAKKFLGNKGNYYNTFKKYIKFK